MVEEILHFAPDFVQRLRLRRHAAISMCSTLESTSFLSLSEGVQKAVLDTCSVGLNVDLPLDDNGIEPSSPCVCPAQASHIVLKRQKACAKGCFALLTQLSLPASGGAHG